LAVWDSALLPEDEDEYGNYDLRFALELILANVKSAEEGV
jgi:hypothetical protein